VFYNPPVNQFPAAYLGKYFFADYCAGPIRVFDPATGTASDFGNAISGPVDLQVRRDGSLYYLTSACNGAYCGEIYRVRANPTQPLNISVRSHVGTGSDVLISGFFNDGARIPGRRIIMRALGPSLQQSGLSDVLPDPVLELHASGGSLLASNNNWKDNSAADQQILIDNQLAPPNELESAIVFDVQPGDYTAVVKDQNGATGVAVVEVYDVSRNTGLRLVNVSGRAPVLTEGDVLISGFILGGTHIGAAPAVVRALGPSLAQSGVTNPLLDPTLEVRDNNGALLIANDNWQDDPNQAAQISASRLAPSNPAESAVVTSLLPGTYTAIVAGKNGGTGVGVVEVYSTAAIGTDP